MLGLPAVAAGLFTLGGMFNENLFGRLIQMGGAVVALIWIAGAFLLIGTLFSHSSGVQNTHTMPTAPIKPVIPAPPKQRLGA